MLTHQFQGIRKYLAAFFFLVLAIGMTARLAVTESSNSIPIAKPEDEGFSAASLQGVHAAVQKHIDAGDVAGVVTLISRNGKIFYWEAQGIAGQDKKRTMNKDDVFLMASMTKQMTATAILMLMEKGKIKLHDPVSKYIPEFAAPGRVRVAKAGAPAPGSAGRPGEDQRTGLYYGNAPKAEGEFVPANRPITIEDLLTHTSGLLSIGPGSIDYLHETGDTLATATARLGTVPLDFQPGTKWAYSNAAGFDALARVVEVASGQPFNVFLEQHLWGPLGMKDTGFGPPKDPSREVSTTLNPNTAQAGGLNAMIAGSTYFSGAAGARSTATDYWKFAQMLLNGGQLDGKRILKPETVAMMTSNHVGNLYDGNFSLSKVGMGFGYSVAVITDSSAAMIPFPNGSFNWNGIGSNWFWVMPKDKMILLILCPPTGSGPVHKDVVAALGQAMASAGLLN
jgi:CubicO group peptidase (beta-lactamase class C family)